MKNRFNILYSKLLSQKLVVFIISLASLLPNSVLAQKLEFGLGLGGYNYVGDISPNFQFKNTKPAGSLFLRYNFNSAFTMRAELGGGIISANDNTSKDPWQVQRNYSFKTRVLEGSVAAEYNFLDFVERRYVINWSPYVFGGIGFNSFKPNIVTSNYKTSTMVMPYGIGVKYQIKRPWSIGLEYGTRKTFTDFLDNLGGDPVTNNKFQQGNPSTKDKYHYFRLSITYTIYKIVCP